MHPEHNPAEGVVLHASALLQSGISRYLAVGHLLQKDP